jgi:hypothetical protein
MKNLDIEHTLIYLAHILIIGPLLVYIGNTYGVGLTTWILNTLIITGLLLTIFHLYLTFKKGVSSGFIYLLHGLIFGPLLIYIGLTGSDGFWGAYSVLMMIGFAAIGYHAKKIIDRL